MAETIATEKPASANASALRTAWLKSVNVRWMWHVPSQIRRRINGLVDFGR